jgi:hypothetical protein
MKNKTKHYSLGKLGHLTAAAVIGLISGYAPETIAATPTIYLQSATINSAADAVTLNRVPVMNAAGTILYKDISMFFTVDTLGNVTLPPALVRIIPSPTINVGAFKPGTYNGFNSPCNTSGTFFKVGSPGVGTGGRISGSIQRVTTYAQDTFNANWTSGPIAGHPDQAKLTAAKITSTAFNWGVVGSVGQCTQQLLWKAGDIIGVVQNGNQLSVVNYGTDNISDRSLTFTLCPTANPC